MRRVVRLPPRTEGVAAVVVPARYDATEMDIGFNPGYLSEALRVMSGEKVWLELLEPARPAILCGEDKADFLYVVMPVSLVS